MRICVHFREPRDGDFDTLARSWLTRQVRFDEVQLPCRPAQDLSRPDLEKNRDPADALQESRIL